MNFNANQGARHPAHKPSSGRRVKHVGDPSVLAPPGYPPPYNPYAGGPPPPDPTYTFDGRGGPPPQYTAGPPGPAHYQGPGAGAGGGGFAVPGQFLSDPLVASAAVQYGQALVGSGRRLVDREIEKYVAVSRLKYYFAVDTGYVAGKLGLLFFPFAHADWSVRYEREEQPVQPRHEINAPDLYIPTMGYVTYVLVAGLVLGMQDRFSPEQLGIQASTALAWLVVEILVELITLYITNIETNLKTFDLIAYGGYKYVGIIVSILISLVFQKTGYYAALAYCSICLAFFLVRTLRAQVLPGSSSDPYGGGSTGNKRRLYFLLFVAGVQPLLMWWMSNHLVAGVASPPADKS